MEDWENRLSGYYGKMMEVMIEDCAGSDPLAPPASRLLHHVRMVDERTYLQFYFNEIQFLAIPVFDDERTRLEQLKTGTVFISQDADAKLIYRMRFVR